MIPVSPLLSFGQAPAPPEVLSALQTIEIETAVDVAAIFRLRLGIVRTATGDWSLVADDFFRPLAPVTIRVQAGAEPPVAVINGYVATLEVTYADTPGKSVLEVTGMDATMLMNLEEKAEAWPNLSDDAIATTIFGRYSLAPRVESTAPGLVEPEGTTLQRSTDIRFLRRLAQRHGFDCYVQPEPLTGLDTGHFAPPDLLARPQAVLAVGTGAVNDVRAFAVRYAMTQPTAAVASGLDVATKTRQPATAPASSRPPLGAEPALQRVKPAPVVRPVETGLSHTAELQALSQAVADRSSFAVVATGTAGPAAGVLRAGAIVSVRGAGRAYNGSYEVARVHHAIGPDGYRQRFEARRNAIGTTGAEVFAEL